MSATTNDEKFKGDIREAVADIMAAKEDVERFNTIEALLADSQSTINDLTNVISENEKENATSAEEVTALKAKVDELEAKAEEFLAQLADATKASEKLMERAAVAEKELAGIAADTALSGRMAELEEAKVALSGEKREAQELRVRDMGEEEFAAYRDERVELRALLEAELKEAASAEGNKGGKNVTAEDAAAIAAAAAAATLNVETASASVVSKWADFGETLAASMRGDKE